MTENCNPSSTSSLKRQSTEIETDLEAKKAKLNECNLNDDSNNELQPEPSVPEQLNVECHESDSNRKIKLASLILSDQDRNVQIYPSQIVWGRREKSAFWPAMVWPSKYGKINDDKKRKVLVSFFGENNANVWLKLDNVFPFDGLESFEKMKHSVNVQHLSVKFCSSQFHSLV